MNWDPISKLYNHHSNYKLLFFNSYLYASLFKPHLTDVHMSECFVFSFTLILNLIYINYQNFHVTSQYFIYIYKSTILSVQTLFWFGQSMCQ